MSDVSDRLAELRKVLAAALGFEADRVEVGYRQRDDGQVILEIQVWLNFKEEQK